MRNCPRAKHRASSFLPVLSSARPLLTVSLRPPTGSISKCDGPGPRFLALFTSTSRRYVVGGPADNIPMAGGPLIGGERAYRVRPILEGAHRGRRWREPRVRSERGQTSAQPLTLTRAVTPRVLAPGNRTPGCRRARQLEDRQRRDGRSGRQPTPADRSQRGTGSQLQPRGASGREWQNAPESSRGYPAVIRQMKLAGCPATPAPTHPNALSCCSIDNAANVLITGGPCR